MAKDLPFDEDTLMLIQGIGGPEEPGQHGRTNVPMPTEQAIDVITQIRDLCEDFLGKAGKEDEKDSKDKGPKDKEEPEDDNPEEEM